MPECFCGCGRPVPFSRRNANALGRKVSFELEVWEGFEHAFSIRDPAAAEHLLEFLESGRSIHVALRALVHQERADPELSTRAAAKWVRFSQRSSASFERRLVLAAAGHPPHGGDDEGRAPPTDHRAEEHETQAERITCPLCGEEFERESEFAQHVRHSHPGD